MDYCRYVKRPTRQESAEEFGKPEHQARPPYGKHTPEYGEKVELLPVCPALECRLGSLEQEQAEHPGDVPEVSQVGTKRLRSEQALQNVSGNVSPDEST